MFNIITKGEILWRKKLEDQQETLEDRTGVRLTVSDMKKLEFCVEKTGKTKTDILREGIDLVYRRLTENK